MKCSYELPLKEAIHRKTYISPYFVECLLVWLTSQPKPCSLVSTVGITRLTRNLDQYFVFLLNVLSNRLHEIQLKFRVKGMIGQLTGDYKA